MPDAAAATGTGSPEAAKDPKGTSEPAEMPPLSALIASAEGGKDSAETLKAHLLGGESRTGKVPGSAGAAGPLEMQQVMAVQVRCGDSAVRVGDLLGLLLGAGTPPEAAAAALGGAFAHQPLQAAAPPGNNGSYSAEALKQAVLLAASQKAKANHHPQQQQQQQQHQHRGQQQQQQQHVYVDVRASGRHPASSPRPSPEPLPPSSSTPESAVSSGLRRRSVAAQALTTALP